MSDTYKRFGTVFEIDGNRLLMKDGDAFFVIGQTFTNLQVSDDYAFGATAIEAIRKYDMRNADTRVRI